MPYFCFGDEDEDIEVWEFLYACNDNDINDLIDYLIEDGWINENQKIDQSKQSLCEWEFESIISKIANNRIRLTKEEDALLKKIADRF